MAVRATDRRWMGVVVASVAAHAAILVVLALQHPQLRGMALPPPIFEVTVAPLYLVEPKARQRQAAPIRPRPARLPLSAAPIAPLYAPPAPSPATGFVVTAPPAPSAQLSQTLRRGGVGCLNPDALSPAERDRCLERLGDGSRGAAYLGQGLSAGKQREFDAIAAQKRAYRAYKEAPMPPGLSTSDAAGGIAGLGDTGHGKPPGLRF